MNKWVLCCFGLVVASLAALGFVVLTSVSVHYATRQIIYILVGLAMAIMMMRTDYRIWRHEEGLQKAFFIVVMIGLLAVFLFKAKNGSHRWLPLGCFSVQPSELAKLLVVIVLSAWFEKCALKVEKLKDGLIRPGIFVAIVCAPILCEIDIGAGGVVMLVAGLLMFVAGTRIPHLIAGALLSGSILCLIVSFIPNRMKRLFDPKLEHQVNMSLGAFGHSDIWGCGYNRSVLKERYLPEDHTDYIFAIGAEELGILFVIAVILLFISFYALSVYIALHAADRFGRFLVVGMSFLIFFQAMFNIGMVSKAFPTKGMALPFFSYGGTNMLCTFFAVGTILSVGFRACMKEEESLTHRFLKR